MHNTDAKYGILYLDGNRLVVVDEPGKGWRRGYDRIGIDRSFFWNLGTDAGTKRFDWRLFFSNLTNSLDWFMLNSYNFDSREQQQKYVKAERKKWADIRRWSR